MNISSSQDEVEAGKSKTTSRIVAEICLEREEGIERESLEDTLVMEEATAVVVVVVAAGAAGGTCCCWVWDAAGGLARSKEGGQPLYSYAS